MPKIIHRVILIAILLAMFPPLLVARARAVRSKSPRVHLIQDMDNQPRFRAQHANEMFADRRAMRAFPPGTVGRANPLGQQNQTGGLDEISHGLALDDHFYRGLVDGRWATDFPSQVPMSRETLNRGRGRFNIFCAPCHGASGDGQGMVAIRADELQLLGDAVWVKPTATYDPTVTIQPVGQLFNTITHGIRTMSSYGSQIPESDRWAIVAWMKAIQRSQNATWNDLGSERDRLEDERIDAIEAQRIADEAAATAAAAEAAKQATGEGGEE